MNHSLIMINSYPGLQTKERLLDTKVISSDVNEQNNYVVVMLMYVCCFCLICDVYLFSVL